MLIKHDHCQFITPPNLYNRKQLDFLSKGTCRIEGTVTFTNGKLNVDGNVHIEESLEEEYQYTYKEIPIKFGKVTFGFVICECGIETLKNCPDECHDFTCRSIESLESLEGAPRIVNGEFDITHADNLETLKGAPKIIRGDFIADFCSALKKLEITDTVIGGEFSLFDSSLMTVEDGPLAKSYNLEKSFDINKNEIKLNNSKLLGEWINSKESIDDFMYKVRGKLAGKKYGF